MTATRVLDQTRRQLPEGFRIRLAPEVRVAARGRVLIGGSPMTALRLSRGAAEALVHGDLVVTDSTTNRLGARLLDTNIGLPVLDRLPAVMARDLTVVVPVRDRSEQLDRLLASLHGLQVVVVDDASHDSQAIATLTQRRGATLVRIDQNGGPAAARNAGLARVHTPLVALVDSDVHVTPPQLLQLARHFADPRVALVGPRIRGVSASARPSWFERYDEQHSSLTLGRRPGVVRIGADAGWLPSACLVGRTGLLRNGFDTRMRVGEDVDLVWRLARDGHLVRYEPAVEVGHDTRSTLRAWLGRKAVYGSGGAALADRHGDALAPAVLNPGLALAAAALLSRHRWSPVAAMVAVAASAHRIERVLPECGERSVVARALAGRGLGWAVRQECALLLRHWWPATVLWLPARPVRRALWTALVVDFAVGIVERSPGERVGLITMVAGRRFDDLAYGAGLWYGAIRARSARVLLPRRPGPRAAHRTTVLRGGAGAS